MMMSFYLDYINIIIFICSSYNLESNNVLYFSNWINVLIVATLKQLLAIQTVIVIKTV